MADVMRMITLSTAHISPESYEKLETGKTPFATYEKGDYGMYVYLRSIKEDSAEYNEIPADFIPVISYARDNDCWIICFDSGQEEEDSLPVYDWEVESVPVYTKTRFCKKEDGYMHAQVTLNTEYVLTPCKNAFNDRISYWLSKKDCTRAMYCFSIKPGDIREYGYQLIHMDGYIRCFEQMYAALAKKKAVPADERVTVVCYGETERWKNRTEAIEFYKRCASHAEGHEKARYVSIIEQLSAGKKHCSDEAE